MKKIRTVAKVLRDRNSARLVETPCTTRLSGVEIERPFRELLIKIGS